MYENSLMTKGFFLSFIVSDHAQSFISDFLHMKIVQKRYTLNENGSFGSRMKKKIWRLPLWKFTLGRLESAVESCVNTIRKTHNQSFLGRKCSPDFLIVRTGHNSYRFHLRNISKMHPFLKKLISRRIHVHMLAVC